MWRREIEKWNLVRFRIKNISLLRVDNSLILIYRRFPHSHGGVRNHISTFTFYSNTLCLSSTHLITSRVGSADNFLRLSRKTEPDLVQLSLLTLLVSWMALCCMLLRITCGPDDKSIICSQHQLLIPCKQMQAFQYVVHRQSVEEFS